MGESENQIPLVKFYVMLEGAQAPQRSDRAAGGIIPMRAYRYCEPMRSASAFGWYVFPAENISLMWDGSDTLWKTDDCDQWYNLSSIQAPNSYDTFNAVCPASVVDHVPSLVAACDEPGIINIWSGIFARTKKDWSLLVRPPANLPRSTGFECYEGIIETDRWFGPLFVNIRMTKTDVPVAIRKDRPLLQVQPLHRSSYNAALFNDFEVISEPSLLTEKDWQDYENTVIAPGIGHDRETGLYSKTSKRRSKREIESES